MQKDHAERDPDGFLDFEQPRFRLTDYEVVGVTPMKDPFELSRTRVVAPSVDDAKDYLLEAGGWGCRPEWLKTVETGYRLVPQGPSKTGAGMTRSEWTQAVLLGYLPNPVRFTTEAITVEKLLPARTLPTVPRPRRRRSLMKGVERFFERQERYPRVWKAIGIVLGVLAAAFALVALWQLLVSMLSLFLVARGVGIYFRRW